MGARRDPNHYKTKQPKVCKHTSKTRIEAAFNPITHQGWALTHLPGRFSAHRTSNVQRIHLFFGHPRDPPANFPTGPNRRYYGKRPNRRALVPMDGSKSSFRASLCQASSAGSAVSTISSRAILTMNTAPPLNGPIPT